jgi:hypothetical protein
VKANRHFELIVSRSSHEPAFLGDPNRLDRIEVVSIDDGEVVLFWDLPVKEAKGLLRELRADLVGLSAEEFMRTWEGRDAGAQERD